MKDVEVEEKEKLHTKENGWMEGGWFMEDVRGERFSNRYLSQVSILKCRLINTRIPSSCCFPVLKLPTFVT